MKPVMIILIVVAAVFVTGCTTGTRDAAPQVSLPPVTTTTELPAPEQLPIGQIPVTTVDQGTAIPATVKKTAMATAVITTPAPETGKPMASRVTVNGTSGKILRFSTVAPGVVKFSIAYGGSYGGTRESCDDNPRAVLRLAGASIDAPLYNGDSKNSYSGTATFNLVSPGNYALTTLGCYGWKVVIDNG